MPSSLHPSTPSPPPRPRHLVSISIPSSLSSLPPPSVPSQLRGFRLSTTFLWNRLVYLITPNYCSRVQSQTVQYVPLSPCCPDFPVSRTVVIRRERARHLRPARCPCMPVNPNLPAPRFGLDGAHSVQFVAQLSVSEY
jgi:hypothetical protein